MKRKINLGILAIVFAFIFTCNVNAESLEVDTIEEFTSCISTENNTCTLAANLSLGTYGTTNIASGVTLDLGGKELTVTSPSSSTVFTPQTGATIKNGTIKFNGGGNGSLAHVKGNAQHVLFKDLVIQASPTLWSIFSVRELTVVPTDYTMFLNNISIKFMNYGVSHGGDIIEEYNVTEYKGKILIDGLTAALFSRTKIVSSTTETSLMDYSMKNVNITADYLKSTPTTVYTDGVAFTPASFLDKNYYLEVDGSVVDLNQSFTPANGISALKFKILPREIKNVVWGTGDNAKKIYFDGVPNAVDYKFCIHKDGDSACNYGGYTSVDGEENNYIDIAPAIAMYGSGSYTATITALSAHNNSEEYYISPTVTSDAKSFTTEKLATPTNLTWEPGIVASWDEVPNANLYTVTVYKDNDLYVGSYTTNTNSINLFNSLSKGISYYFKVVASDTTYTYEGSDASAASSVQMLPWDITKSTEHGSFTIDDYYYTGASVYITSITPETNYILKDIKLYNTSTGEDITSSIYDETLKMFYMPNYDVTVEVNFVKDTFNITKENEHGSITVSETGKVGTTISITNITPNDNYLLNSIKILKSSDNTDVTSLVSYNSETKTFTMPIYDVKVVAYFETITLTTTPILTVKSNGYNSAKITYTSVDYADGYVIYRSSSKTGSYIKVGTVIGGDVLSFINTGLSTNKTYYYKVRAYRVNNGDYDYSAFSSYKYAKIIPSTPIVTNTTNYYSVKLSWAKVTGASGYVIYRSTDGKSYKAYKTITNGSTLTYTNSSLILNKTYYYKVKAYRTVSGTKVYSSYSNIITTSPYLNKVTNLKVSSNYYRYVKISYTKVSGATGYRIYRSTTEDGTYTAIASTTSNVYYDKTAKENVEYYYKVKPYRTISKTRYYGKQYSDIKTGVREPDDIIFMVSTIIGSEKEICLFMSTLVPFSAYEIYRSTSKTGTYTKIKTIESTGTSDYIDTKAKANTIYYYKVRLVGANTSDFSRIIAVGYFD